MSPTLRRRVLFLFVPLAAGLLVACGDQGGDGDSTPPPDGGGTGSATLSWNPPTSNTDGSPLLNLDLPNFIVTPHVAWASDEAVQALADQVIDNVEAFVAGRPQNVLT